MTNQLISKLFISAKIIRPNGKTSSLGAGLPFLQSALIVPRSKTRFQRVWLGDATDKRWQALHTEERIKANQEGRSVFVEPLNSPHRYSNVWSWPSSLVDNYSQNRTKLVVPETLVRKKPTQNYCVVQCLDGYEGQIWHDKALVGSRWWQKPPDSQEWMIFAQGVALKFPKVLENPLIEEVPEPVERPWSRGVNLSSLNSSHYRNLFSPAAVFLMSAAVFAFPIGYYGSKTYNLNTELKSTSVKLSELQNMESQVAIVRSEANANNEVLGILDQNNKPFMVFDALKEFDRHLEGEDYKLQSASLRGSRLEIRINPENPIDLPKIVNSLEQSTMFRDATIRNGQRDEIILTAELENLDQ